MTRSHGEELTPYDPEIERTFHRRKNNIERGENSGETDPEEQLVIVEPTMEAIGAAERPMMLDRESLYEAWERFKSMLRKCPHHELPVWTAAGGTIMKKLPSEAFNIIDEIATNLYSYGQERVERRTAGIHSIDAISALSAQITALTHRMDNLGAAILNGAPVGPCGACGPTSIHTPTRTIRGGAATQIFHGVTTSNKDPRPVPPRQPPPQEPKSNLEEMFSKFITATDTRFQNQDASIRNIEMQLGQLVSMVSGRREGQLPSDTEKNPKEQVNAVTLRMMPSYAKFLKEVISNKRKWENGETVKLNEECSAILQNKLPPKLKDPGSFSIPCTIGDMNFEKALCDLGASINLMPYSIFAKLGMHELTPTIVTLQLADRSIKYPRGIIEDVLVKVGKFVIPVDFVVLDMEEDANTPLILGRPFLATGKALIDVQKEGLCESNDLGLHCETLTPRLPDTRHAICHLDAGRGEISSRPRRYLPLGGPPTSELKPSIEKPPILELKPLPSHLKYIFLGEDETLPVIISSDLTGLQEEKLKRVLRENIKAIGWSIADIRGISPVTCTHKILMEEGHKPKAQPQRRLNPNMQEVVKKEILKWLAAGIIYPISDSMWVSPVQCVPKKGGMTVVTNEQNELIPTRTVTGWRVCIDYRALNDATRKDHFPLPFIDQMVEKLAGHAYYCFLDGYSGYHQVAIAPEDQEKTTFTCPYGTFAFRRMPFGLCNAPATFQRCMISVFGDFIDHFGSFYG
ncbi:UNVERIFIED_CONTAM: Retrovirus-related Pol polyprotein from transposon.6 [Sesamum radiatum]|uniref:Retrovirus-related Pol polyprotein from transposon.6 n=1 Tax=Sesamum radiatum TaxID=300843 RepID=A0AAW2UM90_SESRA